MIFLKKFFALILIIIFIFSGCENTTNETTEITQKQNENIIGVWINYNEIQNLIDDCEMVVLSTNEEKSRQIYHNELISALISFLKKI